MSAEHNTPNNNNNNNTSDNNNISSYSKFLIFASLSISLANQVLSFPMANVARPSYKSNGYVSEPEPNYDSDYSTLKYRAPNPLRVQSSVSSAVNVRNLSQDEKWVAPTVDHQLLVISIPLSLSLSFFPASEPMVLCPIRLSRLRTHTRINPVA